MPSDNNAFTRRASKLSLGRQRDFVEEDSGDNPALANRIAAAPLGLKPVRVRECWNVS